ncbi:hypothetical protein J5N97_023186 [Dioscorea zingiberensis]|uniref:CCHC-type domain-containing protein n=1 Tax=Dioscorea zingiberensis TaxID=325984 RepID=A0A9D5HBB6_9LILI|nr:hypothetical protein J5N97_023186 [Dioscorea zingiberensis]
MISNIGATLEGPKPWHRSESSTEPNWRDNKHLQGVATRATQPPRTDRQQKSSRRIPHSSAGEHYSRKRIPRKRTEGHANEEKGWEEVRRKRSREQHKEHCRGDPSLPPVGRRSPPTIHTPAGMIAACGQCLRLGHKASECRRAATCRRCEGVGHKGANCHAKQGLNKHKGPTHIEAGKNSSLPARLHRKLPPKTPVATLHQAENQEDNMEAEHHYITTVIDNDVLAGMENIKRFTIGKVTVVREGMVLRQNVVEMLKMKMKENWEWPIKPLRDDRYLIACPSPKVARRMEGTGPLEHPRFAMTFSPWTLDL